MTMTRGLLIGAAALLGGTAPIAGLAYWLLLVQPYLP